METTMPANIIRSAFSIIIILISLSTFSQIVYVDINPDTTIFEDGGHYDFNFFNDDSAEFQIYRKDYTVENINVNNKILQDSCDVSAYDIEGCQYSVRFDFNDTINASSLWPGYSTTNMATTWSGYCMHYGSFPGETDAYVGLKWINKGVTYYCWIRVDVADDASWFRVKDYAYSTEMILAGQTTPTSIFETKSDNQFIIYSNEDNISIRSAENLEIKEAVLYDLLSRKHRLSYTHNEVVINKYKLPSGLYFLYISTLKSEHIIKLLIR